MTVSLDLWRPRIYCEEPIGWECQMKQLDAKVDNVPTFGDGQKPERLITADEVAALISISPKSIYRWASEGRLPSFREGRVIRFLASDVEAFIKSRIGAGARGMD